MNVALIGPTGFVGSEVLNELLWRGLWWRGRCLRGWRQEQGTDQRRQD